MGALADFEKSQLHDHAVFVKMTNDKMHALKDKLFELYRISSIRHNSILVHFCFTHTNELLENALYDSDASPDFRFTRLRTIGNSLDFVQNKESRPF